jgi:hypothetical protein
MFVLLLLGRISFLSRESISLHTIFSDADTDIRSNSENEAQRGRNYADEKAQQARQIYNVNLPQ